jgi:hypothetical protein
MKRGRRLFSVALVGRSLFVMKLGQDVAQLVRNGQADMCGIFKQAQALVSSLMVNFLNAKKAPHDCDAEVVNNSRPSLCYSGNRTVQKNQK